MTQIRFYGLKNCDRCRAFQRWLVEHNVTEKVHDLRQDGLARDKLETWAEFYGLGILVNRKGTTWRGLDDAEKATIEAGGEQAITLLLDYPQMMKRPIIELDGQPFAIGFNNEVEAKLANVMGFALEKEAS